MPPEKKSDISCTRRSSGNDDSSFCRVCFSFPGNDLVIKIQLVLLALNLLPILPLDGGQALAAVLETKGTEYSTRAAMLVHSMVILSVNYYPVMFFIARDNALPLLALFLLFQKILRFRFRRYEKAYENIKNKQVDEMICTW